MRSKPIKESGLLDGLLHGSAAILVVLSLLAIAYGPDSPAFAGMPLSVVFSGACLLLCFALCGVSLARHAARRRTLLQVLDREDAS